MTTNITHPNVINRQTDALMTGDAGASGRSCHRDRTRRTLDQMLAAFDPEKHCGEVMAWAPVGAEAFAKGDA